MTGTTPPLLDKRTAADVEAQLRDLLGRYVPTYKEDAFGSTLVTIAGRFAELVIQRLNQVPQKQFIAFLDLLGASQLPPQPARAPLTFSLSAGSLVPGVVPAGTQVAAAPAEGDDGPVVFETERELVVMPIQLTAAFVRDGDRYADIRAALADGGDEGVRIFTATTPVEHWLYVGVRSLFGLSAINSCTLVFTLNAGAGASRIAWERWDGSTWQTIPVKPVQDGTAGFMQSGTVTIGAMPAIPISVIEGIESRWLRCRIETTTRAPKAPTITEVTADIEASRGALPVDTVFANATPIDPSRTFLPFGETPRPGDALYLRCDDGLAAAGTAVTLTFDVSRDNGQTKPSIAWETWNGTAWISVLDPDRKNDPKNKDGTEGLSKSGKGELIFVCPPNVRPVAVNGVEGRWVRARVVNGSFGLPARYVPAVAPEKGVTLAPPTLAPPSINSVQVAFAIHTSSAPDAVLTLDKWAASDAPSRLNLTGRSFAPFTPATGAPAVHFGFEPQPGLATIPNRPVTIFVKTASGGPATPARLIWEYWNGSWAPLSVRDDTDGLSMPGTLEFLAPADFAALSDFGVSPRCWIRARPHAINTVEPRMSRLLLNTTMAAHAVTLRDEPLGSSDGSKRLQFTATRSPILPGQQLHVREPEMPSALERTQIELDEGVDAITPADDTEPSQRDVWVRWHEVPDFHGSGPRDRDYVVDHLTGRVMFGDGQSGLVPPMGVNNIRLARYRTGGGRSGNRAAGTIVQLKTTVPYVDAVTNLLPAEGGADAESIDAVSDRVPREIRHGGRAVTVEDHEDLACSASPDVARARCLPKPGEVTVVIVPRSSDQKPVPSPELIERVRRYLDARRTPTARLIVKGPEYARMTVTAQVAPVSIDQTTSVLAGVQKAITEFLHPLTGGFDGTGWAFGSAPRRADFYALLEAVPGVDYVRTLDVTIEGTTSVISLVYAGVPVITAFFKET